MREEAREIVEAILAGDMTAAEDALDRAMRSVVSDLVEKRTSSVSESGPNDDEDDDLEDDIDVDSIDDDELDAAIDDMEDDDEDAA